ncbi:MAG TPA: IclR family transcriptional regulator, partial [Actinomycetales bacterium]|nr:IclR family transcriptional regulator [Actinomycetales bacterium]
IERMGRQPGRLHAAAVVSAANRLTEVLRRTDEEAQAQAGAATAAR